MDLNILNKSGEYMKIAARSTCTVKGYILFVLQWDYPLLHENTNELWAHMLVLERLPYVVADSKSQAKCYAWHYYCTDTITIQDESFTVSLFHYAMRVDTRWLITHLRDDDREVRIVTGYHYKRCG